MRRFILFVVICQTLTSFADTPNENSITLTPNNQDSFDNFIKAIQQLEINAFLNGQSVFNIKTVTPEQIALDYQNNPDQADKTYKYQTVRITTSIKDIRQDVYNKFFIEAGNNGPKEVIHMYFNPVDSRFIKYKIGSNIDLVCQGAGLELGYATFTHCSFATDYITQKLLPIQQHLAIAAQDNKPPLSKKELDIAILYKTLELQIEDACKSSVTTCFQKTSELLKIVNNSEMTEKYQTIINKYKDLPELPPENLQW